MAEEKKVTLSEAGKEMAKKIAKEGLGGVVSSSRTAGLDAGPIHVFIERMSDWRAGVPSANLWTVNIVPHNSGIDIATDQRFSPGQLLANIKSVNNGYSLEASGQWFVKSKSSILEEVSADPARHHIEMFWADSVSFLNNSVSINDNISGENIPYSGFIQYGKVATNRNQSLTARIRFMCSNIDINEILIDRWIAAIAQQGLIEASGMPNIKADITLTCFAASIVKDAATPRLVCERRKKYTLVKCFPISREQTQYGYTVEDAMMHYSTVDFSVQNYNIEYFVDDPGTRRLSLQLKS